MVCDSVEFGAMHNQQYLRTKGPIYSLNMAGTPVIILNSQKVAADLFGALFILLMEELKLIFVFKSAARISSVTGCVS